MANNRYYLYCPKCKEKQYLGKSLGDGIYNNKSASRDFMTPEQILSELNLDDNRALAKGGFPLKPEPEKAQAEFLEEIYNWMWKHLMGCYKDEFYSGEIFKVLTEYDKRTQTTTPKVKDGKKGILRVRSNPN